MKNYQKTAFFVALLALGLVVIPSCVPPGQETEKPNKTVLVYTLGKLDGAKTHKMAAPNKIRALVTSGDGEWLYVVGDKKASLKSMKVENSEWDDAIADFKGLLKASDRSAAGDLSTHKVNGFNPSYAGLLFTLSNEAGADNKGLVVLNGSGVANASLYPQPDKKFPDGSNTPVLVTKGKDRFVYLFDARVAKKGVKFRPFVEPPRLDAGKWDNSLRKSGIPLEPLEQVFLARTQDDLGNLLLADSTGIKRLLAEDIGLEKQNLDNHGKPVIELKELMLDGKTKNGHINTMVVLDKKFLVVGLKSSGPNNGGIVVTDMTDKHMTFKKFGKGLGLSVDSIATERIKHPEKTRIGAVADTDKGLVFLDNEGKPMELVAGQGIVVTADFINKHKAEIKDYEKAASGFVGDAVPNDKFLGAAQDRNGRWYLAFAHDIFTLDIKTEQVAMPTAPPSLP